MRPGTLRWTHSRAAQVRPLQGPERSPAAYAASMADLLETYLSTDYLTQKQEIQEVEGLIEKLLPCFHGSLTLRVATGHMILWTDEQWSRPRSSPSARTR